MKLSNPWPTDRSIRSPFGFRTHPITGGKKLHRGVDVGGSFPVHCAGDGVIAHIGWSPKGGGNVVIVDHGDIYTVYYHGAHATEWKKGQRINAGDFIYQSGTTGASTGNHLHFEVRTSLAWGSQVDPSPYLSGTKSASALRCDGRLGKGTWRLWQTQLKDAGLFRGRIDGKPGGLTYRAIQQSVGVAVDGIMGIGSKRGVQKVLIGWGLYSGAVDGIWGRQTVMAIQRSLNEGKWNV